MTCPEGDADAPTCILQVADREGFAVVMPDGVSQGLRGGRYWNAGGGSKEYRCVGGDACAEGSDDVAYVDAVLDEVRRAVYVDDARIYATGLSNGAAMSHRLACERADVFAAVAPVAGANQALAVPGCSPSRPVPVLHLHGTDDPCWGFDGAIETNLCGSLDDGKFVEPEKSHAFWLDANGCDGDTTSPVPDASNDGTSTTRHVGRSCDADTELWVVDGGGHAWPGGWPYLGRFFIGTVPQDYSATEAIWTFFAAHPRVP
jgi:polyhydroxybutyrate depolymerase